jgi:hypothetical protein
MGVHALDANLPIPADTHNLRDAMGIVCVSLVDLKRQRGLCMTCVDADDRQLPRPSSWNSQVESWPVSKPIRTTPGACFTTTV